MASDVPNCPSFIKASQAPGWGCVSLQQAVKPQGEWVPKAIPSQGHCPPSTRPACKPGFPPVHIWAPYLGDPKPDFQRMGVGCYTHSPAPSLQAAAARPWSWYPDLSGIEQWDLRQRVRWPLASSYSVCRRNQGSPYGPAGSLPQVFLCLPAGQTGYTLSTRGRGRETEGFSAPEMPPWGSSSEHRKEAAAAGGEPWPEGAQPHPTPHPPAASVQQPRLQQWVCSSAGEGFLPAWPLLPSWWPGAARRKAEQQLPAQPPQGRSMNKSPGSEARQPETKAQALRCWRLKEAAGTDPPGPLVSSAHLVPPGALSWASYLQTGRGRGPRWAAQRWSRKAPARAWGATGSPCSPRRSAPPPVPAAWSPPPAGPARWGWGCLQERERASLAMAPQSMGQHPRTRFSPRVESGLHLGRAMEPLWVCRGLLHRTPSKSRPPCGPQTLHCHVVNTLQFPPYPTMEGSMRLCI